MMVLAVLLLCHLSWVLLAAAEVDPALTGTWVTKSRSVVTGPDFYDPISDRFKEPLNTGFSYSFTDDGYYEEAHYRAIGNPTNPQCPKGIMQFQHGTYEKHPNGSLVLSPFAVDGRQLISNPCKSDKAQYLRYNQTEVFKRYEVLTDKFHNVMRLNLYKHDGSPMNPMYIAYKPPQMLPTQTLNPIVIATSAPKAKRDTVDTSDHIRQSTLFRKVEGISRDFVWWIGLALISIGGIARFLS